jgi:Zn-dependent M28 family amino/carboxypeptidase
VYFGLLALMMKGPANRTTMNDNTSGVAALIGIMTALPEEMRRQCAFVFFDNEEMGMLGSSAFRKKHGKRMQSVPLINLDCIGDGDTLLLAASKAFRADETLHNALNKAFSLPT